jgi:hypothetical protein
MLNLTKGILQSLVLVDRNQGGIHIFNLIHSVDPNTIDINTPNHVVFFSAWNNNTMGEFRVFL